MKTKSKDTIQLLNFFEEIYDLNISTGMYEIIYSGDTRFVTVEPRGAIEETLSYISNNLIYPDDKYIFEDFIDVEKLIEKFQNEEQKPSCDFRRLKHDGNYSWVRAYAAQYVSDIGEQHVLFSVINVHARKTVAERNKNNYARVLQSLGKTLSYIAEINLTDNTISTIKDVRYSEYGKTVFDLVTYLDDTITPFIHHDDLDSFHTIMNISSLNLICDNHSERTFEVRFKDRDDYIWCELHIFTPVKDETDLFDDKKLLLTIRNVSTKKITKTFVDKLIYTSIEFIAFINTDDNTYFVYEDIDNPIYIQLDNKVNNLVKMCIEDDAYYLSEQLKIDNIRKQLEVNDSYTFYCSMHSTDGILRKKFQLSNTDGSSSLVLFTITDVTSVQQAEQERNTMLAHALKETEVANRAKTDFISRMSHDIRTPMNGVIGMTSVALESLDNPEKVKDSLEKINMSSQYLLTLINDILDMSKIESGMMTVSTSVFNLQEFIKSIHTLVYPLASDKKLNFTLDVDDNLRTEYIGDSLRLKQVLMNLLSNAIKFTNSNGTVSLKITQDYETKEFASIIFVISDTGCGMSEKFIQKMYDPFEQEDNESSRNQTGSGLGLAIVHNLVKLMGGDIKVDSTVGVGSTFTIKLLLPFEKNTANATISRMAKDTKLNILIVDDDPVTCEHAQLLLSKISKTITSTIIHSIEEVKLAFCAGITYDIVLLDWRIPNTTLKNSIAKILEVSSIKPNNIILITAYNIAELEKEAHLHGIKAILPKPLTEEILQAAIFDKNITAEQLRKKPSPIENYEGKHILLVDDNNINLEVAKALLASRKIDVTMAVNGEEAIAKFNNSDINFFDAIFMDIRMPIMDGLEATKHIRKLNRDDAKSISIVGVSADAFQQDINNALKSGMNHYLVKPIVVGQLNELLSVLFD